MLQFKYSSFWEHYCGIGEVADDVFVRMYTADYLAMKYEDRARAAEMRPFMNRGMTARRLPPDDPLRRHDLFRLGAFVVHKADRRADTKKQVYVVHPREHHDEGLGTYYTADHFSFVLNRHGPRPLNLHYTTYTAVAALSVPGRPRGIVAHEFSPLPTSFDLPSTASGLRQSGILRQVMADVHSNVLFTMLSQPFTTDPGPSSSAPASSSVEGGSSGRRRRRQREAAIRARVAAREVAAGRRTFDDLWHELPIHNMLVVGIPHPPGSKMTDQGQGHVTVTVIITDRLKYSNASQKAAAVFMIDRELLGDNAVVEARIADALEDLSWEAMAGP